MEGRRGNRNGLGLFLLAYQVLGKVGLDQIPPVTLSALVLQTGMFLGYFSPHGYASMRDVCLNGIDILAKGQVHRVFWSHLEHGSDLHLYYNMMSFVWKGRILEPYYGSGPFALLLLTLMALTGFVYTGLALIAAEVGNPNICPFLQEPKMLHDYFLVYSRYFVHEPMRRGLLRGAFCPQSLGEPLPR